MSKLADWAKTNYPCNVCGDKAIGCYSPDMDIKGMCFCEEHRDEVFDVYNAILSDVDEPIYKIMMKNWKFK